MIRTVYTDKIFLEFPLSEYHISDGVPEIAPLENFSKFGDRFSVVSWSMQRFRFGFGFHLDWNQEPVLS